MLAFEILGCGHFMFLGKPGGSLYLDSGGQRNPSFRDIGTRHLEEWNVK